jgi:hypothetical protein
MSAVNTRRSEATGLAAIQRCTVRVLVAAQIFSGAGLAAGVTVGALAPEPPWPP